MAAITSEQINFQWKYYSTTVSESFQNLRKNSELSDVTLACRGADSDEGGARLFKVHKVILAACSPVLKRLMMDMDSKGATLFLSGIEADVVKLVIDFIYSGSANVESSKLDKFLRLAEELKVEGLQIRRDNERIRESSREKSSPALNGSSQQKPPFKRKLSSTENELVILEDEKDENGNNKRAEESVAKSKVEIPKKDKSSQEVPNKRRRKKVKAEKVEEVGKGKEFTDCVIIKDIKSIMQKEFTFTKEEKDENPDPAEKKNNIEEGNPLALTEDPVKEEQRGDPKEKANNKKELKTEYILANLSQYFVISDKNLHKCALCNKLIKGSSVSALKTHIINKHSKASRIVCRICNKSLKNKNSLNSHLHNYHKLNKMQAEKKLDKMHSEKK